MTTRTEGAADGLAGAWPFLLALAVALLPVLAAQTPPLLDYHNHLARQYILARADDSALLGQWYRTSWHAAPYLAFDGIVQGLSHVMPVDQAGRVFVVIMLALLALAPLAISRATTGRVTPAALMGLLFVHSETVSLGFVNYLFGIGFALAASAAWIVLRDSPARVRLLLFPLISSLVFFSHLLGFVLYVLVIGSYELGRWISSAFGATGHRWTLTRTQQVTLLSIVLQCLLPLSIFAAFGPSTASITSNTHGGLARKFSLLAGSLGYLVPPYLWSLDRALQWLVPVVLLGLLVSRKWRIDAAMRWPLAALFVLYFAMPMELFSGWGADHRLLPAMGLLLVGSIRPAVSTNRHQADRLDRAALVIVAVLVSVRTLAIAHEWRKSDAVYAEFRQAMELVPDGGRMYFAFGHDAGKRVGTTPVYHLPTLVLARRDVYVPYLFATDGGGFTLAYRKDVEPWQRRSPGPVLLDHASPDWVGIAGLYDHLLLVDERHFSAPVPALYQPVFAGPSVRLYRRTAELPKP